MKKYLLITATLAFCITTNIYAKNVASNSLTNIKEVVKPELNSYFNKYKNVEYFSGIGIAVGIKDQPIQSFYIGNVSRSANSAAVNSNSLFQIGSITKSFTAVKILQLVAAGKLKLDDPIGKYLPQYSKWKNVTIRQLLDMSSGLPNYSDTPSWNYQETKNIQRIWTKPQLLSFVYPKAGFSPPIKQGYFYTNTGYILAEMIIEKLTHKTFKQTLNSDILKPLQLTQTFYPVPTVNAKQKPYLMHGYGYNQYDNPALVGHDMQLNNLSWGAAAGGIIATAPQIAYWARDLFSNDKLLTAKQHMQLERLISTTTGKPITQTSANDPKGFGLGVVQSYNKAIGKFWYYEGETLGFRALYMYVPCNQIVIAATVNSATNGENDHLHMLLQQIYMKLLTQNTQYQC